MADTPPSVRDPGPPLGSTADPVGYVPVSWMAVAAFSVTAVFVITLAVLAFTAWRSKSPLIAPQLLFVPVVAVVLAFAARRVVRNSEGTRTGELFGLDLVNAAWWGAVVVGLVYLTYLFAIDFSIRREAEGEVGRWVNQVLDGDLARAFHRTRDPAERASIPPDNAAALEARYRNDWVGFTQADLVRVALRNPGGCSYTSGGMREWSVKTGGAECVATGAVRCPEGLFPVQFQLKATDTPAGPDGGGGRQWQISPVSGAFFREQPALTPYGWLVDEVQKQGRDEVHQFLAAGQDRGFRPFVAHAYAQMAGDPAVRLLSPDAGAARLAAVGAPAGLGWVLPEQVFSATAGRLFRLPGGKQPGPDQARAFLGVWTGPGLVPAGARLRYSGDVHERATLTDAAVEVGVPVELPMVSAKADMAARGRAVVVCTDPGLVAELKQLRATADPDAGTTAPPGGRRPRYPWRLDRIESDMRPISTREADPGSPPGGGPPGGMGH
jgi:hypothetical protein